MGIAYPYSLGTYTTAYGTLSSVYSWYVQWYQYPTNTSTIYSYADATIYAPTPVGTGVQVPIAIYNNNAIYRVGTSGYTAPTFTYKSLPTISLYNVNLGQSIVIYNAEISTTVADNGVGTQTSGSILHNIGVYPIVPYNWFEPAYSTWQIRHSEVVTIVDTAVTQTNTFTSASFVVDPVFNVTVRYADALYKAKNIWVRKDDVLCPVKTMKVKNS
jgi:hypothetical protein